MKWLESASSWPKPDPQSDRRYATMNLRFRSGDGDKGLLMSEISRDARPTEPLIGVSELDRFYHDLRCAVIELEEAYQNGDLACFLSKTDYETRFGTMLIGNYRQLARRRPLADPNRRRQQTVYALLRQIRNELFGIDHWFHAEIETIPVPIIEPIEVSPETETASDTDPHSLAQISTSPADSEDEYPADRDSKPTELTSQIGQRFRYRISSDLPEQVVLRYDQLLAARNWRIGFIFDNQAAMDELAANMAKQSVQQLARDLHDLGKMLPRLLGNPRREFPPMVPPQSGRDPEQLFADIINEHSYHASLSRLCEDYSQKTDLRVKYPDLERNRGARVQVTLGPTRDSHVNKVNGINNPEHFVIVSPWTLANAVPHFCEQDEEHTTIEFSDELIARFWQSIPGQPSDIESLSFGLRKIFDAAILKSQLDPRGPIAQVPPAVREFIRVFVQSEAFRSTKSLREWLASEGRYVRTGDGRLSARRLIIETPNPAVQQFYQQNPAGKTLSGKVISITPHEARVDLGNQVPGRVTKSEISWRSPQVDPVLFLQVNQWSEFVILQSNDPALASAVDLSIKRLKPDPWQGEALQKFKVGEVYSGKVQQQKHYGVFVELHPEFVGLLHETQLPKSDREKLPQLYSEGATMRVRILSINPDSRRISLQPADLTGSTPAQQKT